MATFTGQIALEGTRWIGWIEVASWGRRINANWAMPAVAAQGYRLSSLHPFDHGYTAANADSFVDLLVGPPSTIEERVDLREGRTDLGACSFDLADMGIRGIGGAAHGWAGSLLTDLLAHEGPALTGPYTLAVAASAVAVVFTLVGTAGIVAGNAYWIDQEVVIVTAVGVNTINVIRACYGTTAQAHWISPQGEGLLYDRPRYLRGRPVSLWVNLFESTRTGANAEPVLMPVTEARRVWRGIVDDWEQASPNEFRLACRSALGRMDRTIGREQWRARLGTMVWGRFARVPRGGTTQYELSMDDNTVDLPWNWSRDAAEDSIALLPEYPTVAGEMAFHARIRDQIVECRMAGGTNALRTIAGGHKLLGTSVGESWGEAEAAEGRFPIWDLLLTSPRPSPVQTTPLTYCALAAAEPSCHPVDLALMLITSTGTSAGPGLVGTNGPWDVLPAHWSAGVPIADVDAAVLGGGTWLNIRGRTANLRCPNFVLGWEGKPFRLRDWIEKYLLGPMGWFIYLNESGKIALGSIMDLYPGESWPAITEEDILDEPMARLTGCLQDTITHQTILVGWSWAKQEHQWKLLYRHPQASGRLYDDDSEVQVDARGLDYETGGVFIRSRAYQFARWFLSPLPRVLLSVGLHRLDAVLSQGVQLTCSSLPNPFGGTRGITTRPCFLASRRVDFAAGRIDLELIMLPTPNLGLWVPSGRVVGVAGNDITLQPNDFTSPDGGPDGAPARDSLAFTVGDIVMHRDRRGASASINFRTVTGIETAGINTIRLNAMFPVLPVAGDIVTYCHYEGGAIPVSPWTAAMKQCVAQADDVTRLLPNGDAAYVYGG